MFLRCGWWALWWHYAYLPNGSLQTLTDGEGNQTHYRYNANGQLTQLNTVDDAIRYTYDQAGRVIKIQSTDSTITYAYDINDRVIEETQNNHKIHRTFDDVNNIMTRHLYPNGQEAPISTSYRYNNLGELVELSWVCRIGIVKRKTHKQRRKLKDREKEKEKKAMHHHFIPYASFTMTKAMKSVA